MLNLRQHINATVTVDELATLVGLSRLYFCTVFRHAAGLTPHGHITKLRVIRAKELLSGHPDWNVAGVGVALGYHTAYAFWPTFKQIAGLTPAQFRHWS